jgi:tight adherence protein B
MSVLVMVAGGTTLLGVFLAAYSLLTTYSGKSAVVVPVNITKQVTPIPDDEKGVTLQLNIAGLKIAPNEWVMVKATIGIVVGLICYAFSGLYLAIAGFILGYVGCQLWLRRKVSRKRRAFEEDLVEVLKLKAGSLRGGHDLMGAISVASVGGWEPMSTELKRMLSKHRLGQPVEDGLEEVSRRMKSQDYLWVSLAVRIQKEVGGDLAGVLETTAETVRERFYLKRQIRSLSAEGRLSAYILLGLPIVVGAYLQWKRPEYMMPLWTTSLGLILLGSAVVLMASGAFWMSRIIKVEA